MNAEYVVKDRASLARLRTERELKNQIRKIKVLGSDGTRLNALEKRLNRYYFACGCKSGAAAVYAVLFGCLLYWWGSGFSGAVRWYWLVGVLFLAAFAGKVVGLVASRFLLRRVFGYLEVRY